MSINQAPGSGKRLVSRTNPQMSSAHCAFDGITAFAPISPAGYPGPQPAWLTTALSPPIVTLTGSTGKPEETQHAMNQYALYLG
jgi:hypothetical protein